jgi:hypothetical protein
MKTFGELLDEIYAKVGRERYEEVRLKVSDMALDAVKDIVAEKDRAFNDYCVAERAFNILWQAAWDDACAKVLAEEDTDGRP